MLKKLLKTFISFNKKNFVRRTDNRLQVEGKKGEWRDDATLRTAANSEGRLGQVASLSCLIKLLKLLGPWHSYH